MNDGFVNPKNARNQEYQDILLDWERRNEDPFTQENLIASGIKFIAETEDWVAFTNENPYPNAKIHFVLVSKKYAETPWELSNDTLIDLMMLRKKLCEEFKITGGAYVERFGNTNINGGTVSHFHCHIIVPENGTSVAAWFTAQ